MNIHELGGCFVLKNYQPVCHHLWLTLPSMPVCFSNLSLTEDAAGSSKIMNIYIF